MRHAALQAPPALVTLPAHHPAPARVELVYKPLPGRAIRALLCLVTFWGAIPLLFWVPPHYPWVLGALVVGSCLAYRQWTGRYLVRSFAGVCPRCGGTLTLGVDRVVSLPHTLTCYRCHFEPQLEVRFGSEREPEPGLVEHGDARCVGVWQPRWLADEPFLVCSGCHAGCRATPEARRAAEAENRRGDLLDQLTREGGLLL